MNIHKLPEDVQPIQPTQSSQILQAAEELSADELSEQELDNVNGGVVPGTPDVPRIIHR